MKEKLKEIRYKYPDTPKWDAEQIQSQTVEMVLSEIEGFLDEREFCKCEPLSSGEEYCNDGCVLRDKLNQIREQIK